jgi:hypothetical protein
MSNYTSDQSTFIPKTWIESPRLESMRSGQIELSVPKFQGIIQIGAVEWDDEDGKLTIIKDGGHVTIRDKDDNPIQVELVNSRYTEGGGEPTLSEVSRLPVFETAVPEVHLHHHRAGSYLGWIATDAGGVELPITSNIYLDRFVYKVADYACYRQLGNLSSRQ